MKARTQLGRKSVAWWARQPIVDLDPRQVRWANTPVDRKAVEHYKRHPHRPYNPADHDGDPCVVRAADGTLEGRNGKHRAIAAIETGRRLKVRLHDEGTPQRQRGWFSW